MDSDKPIFYDVDKVKKHNMISTFSKKTNKLAKAPFEGINQTLYSPKAFYNGFRTNEEHLPYWIQGMYHSVYRDLATDLDVDWDEQNTPIDLKIRISDPNVKDDEGKSRYKFTTIWVYRSDNWKHRFSGTRLSGGCTETFSHSERIRYQKCWCPSILSSNGSI